MLKVSAIQNSKAKWPLWHSLDPFKAQWVVSDLRSKLELQNFLLENRDGIPGDSVIRANEFWRQIFSRAYPLFQCLPNEWSQVVAERVLTDEQFQKFPALRGTVVNLMNLLAPVLFHPSRLEVLTDMGEAHPSMKERFGNLLPSVIALFDHIIGNQWILESWVPAALESWGVPASCQFQSLVFDLGPSLTSVEADLIEVIAQRTDVRVLIPAPTFSEAFQFLLAPSQQLFDRASDREVLSSDVDLETESQFLKFSGRLAEVRHCVAQVREWLEQGIELSRIAVVTPFFEQDLAVMEPYFRVEGIPLVRSTGLRVQSIAAVQSALARLRLSSPELRFSDLELSFRDYVPERFENFKATFREAMDASDFDRSLAVQKEVKPWLRKETEIGLDEFFEIVSSVWPHEGPGSMAAVFNDLFESTPRAWRQSLSGWVSWFESRIARLEYSNPELAQGLQILPLKSADLPGLTHRLFLGMVEKLPEMSNHLMNAEEISRLGWTYGFFLPHPEQTVLQFEIQWLTSQNGVLNIFSYPTTDWTGGLNSPQAFWLKGAGGHSAATTLPKPCRWDEIQATQKSQGDVNVESRIQRDLGEKLIGAVPPHAVSYSISSLEKFGNCAFVFAAEKRFGLKDKAVVDLDFDRMGMGQFYHRLLELLTGDPIDWNPSETKMDELIEKIHLELTDFKVEASLWPAFAARAKTLGRRFLAQEKKWQSEFPQQRVLERELGFEFWYNESDKTWSTTETVGGIQFRGRIDRVSGVSEGPVAVYDYKSSTSAKHSFGSWRRENNLQLAFYSWAMNEGLVSEKYKDRVVAACYYNLKKMDPSIGFQLPGGIGRMYAKSKPKDMSEEKIKNLWTEVVQDVTANLHRAQTGEIAPVPRKPEHCPRCEWKNLCRAPHLQI